MYRIILICLCLTACKTPADNAIQGMKSKTNYTPRSFVEEACYVGDTDACEVLK